MVPNQLPIEFLLNDDKLETQNPPWLWSSLAKNVRRSLWDRFSRSKIIKIAWRVRCKAVSKDTATRKTTSKHQNGQQWEETLYLFKKGGKSATARNFPVVSRSSPPLYYTQIDSFDRAISLRCGTKQNGFSFGWPGIQSGHAQVLLRSGHTDDEESKTRWEMISDENDSNWIVIRVRSRLLQIENITINFINISRDNLILFQRLCHYHCLAALTLERDVYVLYSTEITRAFVQMSWNKDLFFGCG